MRDTACIAATQLRPFQFVTDIRIDGLWAVAQVLANVALFVPFGVLARLRTGRPLSWAKGAFARADGVKVALLQSGPGGYGLRPMPP